MQKPRCLSHGTDHLWKLQHRRYRRLHRLYSKDKSILCHISGSHPTAAAGILRKRLQGTRRRQTEKPCKECNSRIIIKYIKSSVSGTGSFPVSDAEDFFVKILCEIMRDFVCFLVQLLKNSRKPFHISSNMI